MPQTKEWTLMFYFASDNPLASSIVSQLKAIKDAGFHPEANVIAQFDPHTENTPAHIFDVNLIEKLKADGRANVGFNSNDPFVRNLVSDKLWGEAEIRDGIRTALNTRVNRKLALAQNGNGNGRAAPAVAPREIKYDPPMPPSKMSDDQSPKEALAGFLDFCREEYPARHYLLFILGHGVIVGNDLFLFDEHAPEHSLLLTDLGEVLRKFKSDIGEDDERGELELIGFHSCSMSGLEVAFELKGTANYMLASQGPAFVGSWPYRQILIRVFNDLHLSRFTGDELMDATALTNKFQDGTDAFCKFLRSSFEPETVQLLEQHDALQPPAPPLRKALIRELNKAIDTSPLHQLAEFPKVELSKATKELIALHERRPLNRAGLRRLNRLLLVDVCQKEMVRVNIKSMLTKIFYYCLYNSFDFQLAGYSFDLTLCDLNNVRKLQAPLDELSLTLRDSVKNVLAQELILLAHWDAQSYWNENYTDLYDFCFRLSRRCEDTEPLVSAESGAVLAAIREKCGKVMDELVRGVEGEDDKDKIIVRSEFLGASYQYSHGFSIFFPWSKPVDSMFWEEQYEQYKLIKKTAWKEFLENYFEATMRPTQAAERASDPREIAPNREPNIDEHLLELLQDITGRVFNVAGQLGDKDGQSELPPDKNGPHDPTGDSCTCPTIKNHPSFTHGRRNGKTEACEVLTSKNFFDQFKMS